VDPAIDVAAARCDGGVRSKHPAQVWLAEDQHPLGDLGSDGQHEAFGEAVRAWTPRRDLDHLNSCVRQDRVKGCRDLPGTVADEEPKPSDVLAKVRQQVAGMLGGSTVRRDVR